ncbi:methionine ABC transporter ATP-binding protein [Rhodocyclus tenuis]|uniref:Cell division ATP-binding protein FtsE n=2 Tax=Rhodocyclus TaxID=1064 RepID=A0A6L5JT97_RHOTE|nr:methionine ABC transporter ATP-binding protein [Rhodocyclus gracilis]MQY50251.1 ATP-binding cassette domain-containing protein [Rhodocyclus gracilis]NJA87754.1 methionine ABC transporter ATP-binding protein [Rhodocyclus gracilis]
MIQLQGITKFYAGSAGRVEALSGIDLKIDPGEIFGIIGRSGAGKSTLIRCINLLERPSEGHVLVAGRDLTVLDAAALRAARHEIGMIFQHFNLLSSRTVFDNVALPLELIGMTRSAIEERVTPLLDLVGLGDHRGRYPAQLSGGQKQRVGIARALASQPKVLLCDEATSALDPETTRSILALLRDINRRLGLTVVVITHEMQVIKDLCDRVAVLDGGRIIEQGDVFSVFTQPQMALTQTLIRDVIGHETPPGLLERLSQPHLADGAALRRLFFSGQSTDAPLISELSRRFSVDINILHGQIDEIRGRPFGSLLVLAKGEAAQLEAAWAWLAERDVRVEVAHVQ